MHERVRFIGYPYVW